MGCDLDGSSRTEQARQLQARRPHDNAWLAEFKTASGYSMNAEKSGV
jgi:hypothetical protein